MMKKKVHIYESDGIKITYDLNRCIHAGECVRGLPDVFNTKKRPWVQPGNASAEEMADVIEKCPTGALHYEMKTNNRTEHPPSGNRIVLRPNGPVYFYGDIEVQDHEGNTVLKDTRFAFCRCGASGNKPACDNSHQEIRWKGGIKADTSKMPEINEEEHGKLLIKLMKNGPAILEGSYTMESASIGKHTSDKGVALCRCGGSSTKPFCDGTHKQNGFEG
jgi:CDGSH-type Zn-finger protein/uncharacterized Fe-S cluster protein YjdI